MENNKLTNFVKVYKAAILRVDNLFIFVLSFLFAILFGKFFLLALTFFTLGILAKAFILSTKPTFIFANLNSSKTFDIKELIQNLTKKLNKPYLEQVKINFQNCRSELIKIQKNLDLISKNRSQNNNNSNLEMVSFENTGLDNLDFLPQVLPELVDKVMFLSDEEQKIRRFLQGEDKIKIQSQLKILKKENNWEIQKSNSGNEILESENWRKVSQKQSLEEENCQVKKTLESKNKTTEQIENVQNQLSTIISFENQIDQIENYLSQIQTELSAISLFTAKLSLPNSKISENEYLLGDINKLNSTIDVFAGEINKTL